MEASKAGSKILAVCDKCGKRMGVDASFAGRSVKCPCGNVFKVSGSSATETKANTAPSKTSNVAHSKAVAKPLVPAPTSQASFLDQLTAADFSRPSSNPYDPPSSKTTNEAAVLRKYSGAAAKAAETGKTANGNITFLAILNFIGATVYIALGVVILVLSSVLGAVANVLPMAALGVFFAGILFVFGVFDFVCGIGLVKRTFWGWWLCMVGLSWAFFDRGFGVVIQFMNANDWTNEIPKAIGAGVFMSSSLYFMFFLCQKPTMKMFKIHVHPGVVWAVVTVLGLIIGGFGFGAALYAMQQADPSP